MTRAEEKALEIFPVKKVPYYGLTCNAYSERDANFDKRALFCMGYEQVIKDIREWVEEQKRLIEESSANDIRKGASIVILDNLMKDFSL